MPAKFLRGEIVEILEEYRDQGDDKIEWQVVENEEKGRVTLVAANSSLSLKPRFVVQAEWIRHKPSIS
jgi:hypothetical protein